MHTQKRNGNPLNRAELATHFYILRLLLLLEEPNFPNHAHLSPSSRCWYEQPTRRSCNVITKYQAVKEQPVYSIETCSKHENSLRTWFLCVTITWLSQWKSRQQNPWLVTWSERLRDQSYGDLSGHSAKCNAHAFSHQRRKLRCTCVSFFSHTCTYVA